MTATAKGERSSRSDKGAAAPVAFRRYTNLAAAIHLLQAREITLLDPASWDDKNDAFFMREYKAIRQVTNVFAICFAETQETYHHWRVFSAGVDGVCIEFNKDAILSAFDGHAAIRKGPVTYRLIDTLRKREEIDVEELPFLKRKPYEPECEYRVVFAEEGAEPKAAQAFPIELDWIRRITLSPWMHESLRASVSKTLRAIPGCSGLKVARSTLVGNREWQALTQKARARSGEQAD